MKIPLAIYFILSDFLLAGDQPLPHMISPQGIANILIGQTFLSKARNGTVGTLFFADDGTVTFKGNDGSKDFGVYKISETGYCSRWKSMEFRTQCFMISPIQSRKKYQVWTVYGEKVDQLYIEGKEQ